MQQASAGVQVAAADVAAVVAAHGWDAVFDPATAPDLLSRGVTQADAGEVEALAALTTTDGITHELANTSDPTGAAQRAAGRLTAERGVPPVLATWATHVVLEVVRPGWGVHLESAAAPPPAYTAPTTPFPAGVAAGVPTQMPVGVPAGATDGRPPRGAARYVFPIVTAVVVLAAVVVALVFLLGRGDGDETAATTSRSSTTTPAGQRGSLGPDDDSPTTGGSKAHVEDLEVSGTAAANAPAPAMSGPDVVTNDHLSLASMKGKPTLVVFWAHWCPHCQKMMPVFQRFADEHADEFNVLTVATAIGAQPSQPQFSSPKRLMTTQDITLPTMRDGNGAGATAYAVTGFPAVYLVDANGVLVGSSSGEMTPEELLAFARSPTFASG